MQLKILVCMIHPFVCVGGDSNAVEDFLGYIGVEVQITTSHQYFLGHLWKIIIGKQRFKVRRTMDIDI